MRSLKSVKFGSEISVRVLVSRSTILELRVKPRLHLSLLEQHLLSHLVDGLLILNGHCISGPPHLLFGLLEVTLNLLTLFHAVA